MLDPWKYGENKSEHAQQVAFFIWAAVAAQVGFDLARQKETYFGILSSKIKVRPCAELTAIFAIPNGGDRDAVVAARLKAEGVRAGVPDVFWPLPRAQYHGLFIEFKHEVRRNHKSGGLSSKQEVFSANLIKQGYCVEIAYSWQEATEIVERYCASGVAHGYT